MSNIGEKFKGFFFGDSETDESNDFIEESIDELDVPQFEKSTPRFDARPQTGKVVSMPNVNTQSVGGISPNVSMKMIVYQPIKYEDAQNIVDNLRARKPIIVNMVDLEKEPARRIVDFISGAVYALNGGIRKITTGIFVIVPSNVSLVGNGEDDGKEGIFRT